MAMCFRRTIQFCREIGFDSVALECSNSAMVSLINSKEACYTEVGFLVEDIKVIAQFFSNLAVIFQNLVTKLSKLYLVSKHNKYVLHQSLI